ncbi:Glycerol-3-phosphate acyltransferase [Paenibacillus allorhizoplanae]|uniref:Glycerol-3-phosphate acyltransferase n=1 Tax=Paenibacillus allorhizoplanae TaxID=2905648 RepID=A0ABM9BXM1_9BACL|nr:glycerol-3-phosphate 1-O-acyltransferase PlsY [Paenibacillus allorhizoplanae]CAH1197256.1 Glycerol-3-phosphate acyltransferase [Paenibacillus allorhizoplanae]
MLSIITIVVGYLLGSISFSYLFGKWFKGIDIRKHGSGNAGATNTLRVLGKGPAILVLLLDALKGVVAVLLGVWAADDIWISVLCGLAAIVGHNWPVFFGFRGGKGIATTIGVMATLCFVPTLIAGLTAIAIIAITRFVSLGSLILTALLPFLIWGMDRPLPVLWISILLCAFAFLRHRTNIVKLIQGKENKLGQKRA